MQVRVFKSQDNYSDFEFGVMPEPGQQLHFVDGSTFYAERVGFVQNESQFLAAVWLRENPRRDYDLSNV